jgi:threonine dehydrogenase-like Zn-dependent dehydrogenase
MQAVVLTDQLRVDDRYPVPSPNANEVLIRVTHAGICNTDLELVHGYKRFQGVLGHEFVGIAQTGDLAGKRVVSEINVACHYCDLCLEGMNTQCRNRRVIGIKDHQGAFAEWICISRENLHVVPEPVSNEAAIFVEPLAAAFAVNDALHASHSDDIVLIGAGKLGLLVAQTLRKTGARVRVIARRSRTIQLLQRWGLEVTAFEAVATRSASVVVDCTGHPEGFAMALEIIRPRGTLVMKSSYAGKAAIDLTQVVVDELHVVGSRCGNFEPAIAALANQNVDVLSMVDGRYPLSQAQRAFAHASQAGVLKLLLEINLLGAE